MDLRVNVEDCGETHVIEGHWGCLSVLLYFIRVWADTY